MPVAKFTEAAQHDPYAPFYAVKAFADLVIPYGL